MNEREQLVTLARLLPEAHVREAIELLLEIETAPLCEAEFRAKLAEAPSVEIDEKTAARLDASRSEPGADIPFEEIQRRIRQ